MNIDAIRASYPELGLALYAMEPRGAVTLEVYTPDGEVFSFKGVTQAEVLERAFPTPPAVPPPPKVDVFS